MRRQGERPELIRWRLCGTSKTWSFVPQRRMKMFGARVCPRDRGRATLAHFWSAHEYGRMLLTHNEWSLG
jgi:hypothetical protein